MLCVGGSELARVSSRLQAGRQPYVRPVSAVHECGISSNACPSENVGRLQSSNCIFRATHERPVLQLRFQALTEVAMAISTEHRRRFIQCRLSMYDGTLGYPTDGCSPLFGSEEWTPCIRAVVEACDRFVCIELGAGWGTWLVATAAVARQRGVQLAGVEASNADFQFMGFRNNGLEADAHFPFRGVIGAPVLLGEVVCESLS
jgi:hypothetical protein